MDNKALSARDWGQSQLDMPMSSAAEKVEDYYRIHMPAYVQGFLMDIDRFNSMYKMPTIEPGNFGKVVERLGQFKRILEKEIKEFDDIQPQLGHSIYEFLVPLSDILGDIIVYCASEAKRWNIPIDRVLNVIMQSNFSKLDSNGQPIYDADMKLEKGPNYWKPEPKIEQLLIEWNMKTGKTGE